MSVPNRWYVPTSIVTPFAAADLQNLSNGSAVTGSTAVANQTNLDLEGALVFEIEYNSISGIAAGTKVAEIYRIPAIDGTNYPTLASGIPAGAQFVGALYSQVPSTSAIERLVLEGVVIPPFPTKFVYVNKCGQSTKNNTDMIGKFAPYQMQAS